LVRLTEDGRQGLHPRHRGHQLDRAGFYFPTILTDGPADADLMIEEPSGPIAAVIEIDDMDKAIDLANAAPYSFAVYLFTDSLTVRTPWWPA
jgi:succinate-semialdehyde dehydrogenase/glutarate-semialdehyde dehydrogenase